MSAQPRQWSVPAAARQRGQATLLVVLLVGVGIVLFAYSAVNSTSLTLERDRITTDALAQARQALIGRAVADDNRPGSLLCPDTDDDGSAEVFVGNDCPSYIGRLPWRTLGLPDLRDGEGERLWYALSNNFRDHSTAEPINSDTKGNRTVYSGSTAVTLTAEAVAVVFAPGATIGAQIRDTTAAACVTTGTTIARNLCAANYLEATGGANNAALGGAGPFVSALRSGTFNDRLLVLTTAELMPPVEQRVARELINILKSYKTNTACSCTNLGGNPGCYPWADLSDGNSDAPPFDAVGEGRNRGRFPALGAAPHDWGTNPCGTPVPSIPSWFVNNNWRTIVYYSAGKNYLGPDVCSTCIATTLTVAAASKEALIMMPGPLLGAPPRSPVSASDPTYWQYFFEDAANADLNDTYVTPTATAYTRDRIFTIP